MQGETFAARGLDGEAVRALLQGAVRRGKDAGDLLRAAGIDPEVYGQRTREIDGRALVRLVRQSQFALDDVYLGFFANGCRLALETERIISLMSCATFGEALRVSIRFTNAMSADAGPAVTEERGAGLHHTCGYHTIEGLDRQILVWIRFLWIYHFFSWLIGRPLALRGLSIQGPRPSQDNGFDRFAIFRCPVRFDAPVDALVYDWNDLSAPLAHSGLRDYEAYYASGPDWFETPGGDPGWRERTEQALLELHRGGDWSPSVEAVAARLRTRPRRLRRNLSQEGACFQEIRTRLRGELAGAYLLASDIPVTQIGLTLGFSDPGSFSRQFAAWAGMTPSAYRARYGGDATRLASATAVLSERRVF
ncbi:AraC family transcriptional regulator ligand-binding domain-containing protein [Phenylobacterium sp. VNQ135]|uniref:AraC family transcriptional regulator ligand-binding domain-containing protein n=1 Tax=Phenylobacterium sp. VNQ135 TaxID=3400922 RepID=UPI003C077D7E